ncbi:REn protein [Clerodendron golden mosaic virus]|uniref:Replication enhancer n=1 Tax=Clerodendron golden mosaic virus TaxID=390438 RepID=A5H156_9GEMI|nr:REn protein [Clerodendron golden mosaic virus]ABG26021.1 REn protein [Clerodendron golden mosaic virus]AEA10362.1 REn protein [Clerodendron golden mosaic virus]UOQ23440.1 replication enhancer protein [Clerodendron golden mosaic virus]
MDSRTGEIITATQAESGVFIWEVPNPLYFKIISHLDRPMFRPHDIITIQIQFNHNLRRALGLHKCFLSFRIYTRLNPPTGRFLRVFKNECMKYLDSLGVISINNVIRTVRHVLYDVIAGTLDVIDHHSVNFKYY